MPKSSTPSTAKLTPYSDKFVHSSMECEKMMNQQVPIQVKYLYLDNCPVSSLLCSLEAYTNLELLSLVNTGLVNLDGFPILPKLLNLNLSENPITDGLHQLHGSPKLTKLHLSVNVTNNFKVLEPLSELRCLKRLDISQREVTNDERDKIFKLIPSLKYLNGLDRDNKEEVETEEELEDDYSDITSDSDDDDDDESWDESGDEKEMVMAGK
jgi:acidic leucine-rich nuclear phosphoprotein 32 family member A/C/D